MGLKILSSRLLSGPSGGLGEALTEEPGMWKVIQACDCWLWLVDMELCSVSEDADKDCVMVPYPVWPSG